MYLEKLNNKPLWKYNDYIYVDSYVQPTKYEPLLNQLALCADNLAISNTIIVNDNQNRYSSVDNYVIYLNLLPALQAYNNNTSCSYFEYDHIKDDPEIGSFLFISWKEYVLRELCHEYAHIYDYSGVINKNYPTDDSSHDKVWQSCYAYLINKLTKE
jgi:hypothetical protein